MFENNHMTVFWDVPVYADQTEVGANRVGTRTIDRARRRITLLEMSCPWIDNHQQKEAWRKDLKN